MPWANAMAKKLMVGIGERWLIDITALGIAQIAHATTRLRTTVK
jgi:hypothetical protein